MEVNIIAIILYFTISIALPISLFIYAVVRRETIAFILGAAAFTISQIGFRIPILNALLSESATFIVIQITEPYLYAFLLALSAGLVEETARYVALRFFIKIKTVNKAIYFGLGHGGIEALLIVGIPFIMQYVLLKDSPELSIYLGAFERLCAIIIHVCLSVMVMQSLKEKKIRLFLLAIFLHFIINFLTYVVVVQVNPIAGEGVLALLTVLILTYTIYLSRRLFVKNEKNNVDAI